jgi:hypothetical protein
MNCMLYLTKAYEEKKPGTKYEFQWKDNKKGVSRRLSLKTEKGGKKVSFEETLKLTWHVEPRDVALMAELTHNCV